LIFAFQHCAGKVGGAAHAGRAVIERARLGPGERDQLRYRSRLDALAEHDHVVGGADQRYRRKVLQRVVRFFLAQQHVRQMRLSNHGKGVAVGRSLPREVAADQAAGARPVVDDELLSIDLAEPLHDDAPQHIARSPRRKRYDEADRFRGPLVRHRRGGHCAAQHENERCHCDTAWCLHGIPFGRCGDRSVTLRDECGTSGKRSALW
jgi:hypothetical protein